MEILQHGLSECEREIDRLKEKLRDLTKKLQQEQHYNSKLIPSRHPLGCFSIPTFPFSLTGIAFADTAQA